MPRRHVRCEFTAPGRERETLFIDLIVDDDLLVTRGPPICGWWGKARAEDVWPFVAWSNSQGEYTIDFGEWNEEGRESRYRPLTIPEQLIIGCEAVFVEGDDDPVRLHLRKVTDIASAIIVLG